MDRRGVAHVPVRGRRSDERRGVRGVRRGDRAIGSAWRLIRSAPARGSWNLALDEAIFDAVRDRRSPPTLRLYRWSSPTLSIGYAQDLERDVDRAACRRRGIAVVRRITGGRAVLHDAELTYSVSVPPGLPGFGAGLDGAYRHVAAGLLAGLRLLGLDGASAARGTRGAAAAARHPGCFAARSRHEIEVGGRKLVGSAQRRQDGGFLQHGSILIESHGGLLGEVLRGGAAGAGTRMVGLAELLVPCPPPESVADAVAAGCAAAWGCTMVASEPAAAERGAAGLLEAERYAAEGWNAGRVDMRPGRSYHAAIRSGNCPVRTT